MYIAILGRQPALGMAELERIYGAEATRWFSDQSATIEADQLDISRFGGTLKAGQVVATIPSGDWRTASTKIIQLLGKEWSGHEGKITLGISAYGFPASPRDVQKTGLLLKSKLKKSGVSLRLIPNPENALNTAASHHNKLGLSDNKIELLIVRARNGRIVIARSTGAQNITAYTRRDQSRPKRDAFVGMLPPKLAQIMINLAGSKMTDKSTILDPFCGTGVVLQEAALMGYLVYGTDLADKMIDYTKVNLEWLQDTHHIAVNARLHQADATDATWQSPIDAVVCEGYLGQPFSAPPSPFKLTEVRGNCNHIMSTFLKNIASQLTPGTPLCIAVPAWRDANGGFTHLPLIDQLDKLGYQRVELKSIKYSDMLYFREDQVVARELLVLTKS